MNSKSQNTRMTAFLTVSTCILLISGCQIINQTSQIRVEPAHQTNQPVSYFLSPHFQQLKPNRLVIVSADTRDASFRFQRQFAKTLARQLQTHGVVETVFHTAPCSGRMDMIRKGIFDEREMLNLATQYNADGVLFCDVTDHSMYQPLLIAASVALIDTRESIVSFSANGTWSANDPSVRTKFKQFTCRRHSLQPQARDINLQSPTEFTEFATSDLAEFMKGIF